MSKDLNIAPDMSVPELDCVDAYETVVCRTISVGAETKKQNAV